MDMFKVSGDTPAILDRFGSKLALKRSSGKTYDGHSHIKISQIMLGIGLSSGTHIEVSDDSTAFLHMVQAFRPFITGDCLYWWTSMLQGLKNRAGVNRF